ncbi:MAG: hypothetical protein AAF573_17445 [Bacteroidota bacterium]
MRIQLLETKTGKLLPAQIKKATFKDMPLKKDGWNFNWRSLFRIERMEVYKVSLVDTPDITEGVIAFSLQRNEMIELEDVEIAPYNIGRNGKYKRLTGALIAFCCLQSQTRGKGNYRGFVGFTSKTDLIAYYRKKYGASQAFGQRMFFSEETGKILIKKYLENEENKES